MRATFWPFRWPSWSSVRTREAQRVIQEALPHVQRICSNPACKHRNPTWAKYCARCGHPLYLQESEMARYRRAWGWVLLAILVAGAAVVAVASMW